MKASVFALAMLAIVAVAAASEIEELKEHLRYDYPRLSEDELYELAKIYVVHQDEVQAGIQEDIANTPVLRAEAFDCPALPPAPVATNVHELKPADIAVVGAIGDSITCGSNAESTTWLNLKQYPGLAWDIGGDDGATTMPNFLKKFNPNLKGMSVGTGDNAANRHCNKAVGGAIVQDMPSQATQLINDFKDNPNIDWENDWKLVTIWIGGNNLCEVCKDAQANSAATYKATLNSVIEQFSAVPRTLVQLVPGLKYTQLVQFKGPFCSLALPFVCDCLTSSDKSKQEQAEAENILYNDALAELAQQWSGTDDFNVVLQPYLQETVIPDKSYISTADCFHPSGKGQALIATGLWNSMITPIAQKPTSTTAGAAPLCPTAETLIYN